MAEAHLAAGSGEHVIAGPGEHSGDEVPEAVFVVGNEDGLA